MAIKVSSSQYINEQRRNYSLYVMQMRAICAATDGLKAAQRRILWMASDGKLHKTNSLAAETTAIHPHDAPEDVVYTLAFPYANNIPLLRGDGAFGTLLENKVFGAARYTKVQVSKFTQDVLFKDIEVIPMTESYDGELVEPIHFIPLIPIALLNPSEGIAVGFASYILPRSLEDIILCQIQYMKGAKKISVPTPKFIPTNNVASKVEQQPNGNYAYWFEGDCEILNRNTVRITNLPYGLTHKKLIEQLNELIEQERIYDYEDGSRDKFCIEVKFKSSDLQDMSNEQLSKMLLLDQKHVENFNVLDFSGSAVWSTNPIELICKFTDWRLKWYVDRYQRLLKIAQTKLQQYLDIRTAIKKNVGKTARELGSRKELIKHLISLDIVYTDFIADLGVYRFTQEEFDKNEKRIQEIQVEIDDYEDLLKNDQRRKKVYIKELEEILKNYNNGEYDTFDNK